jgi:hypothetical protein
MAEYEETADADEFIDWRRSVLKFIARQIPEAERVISVVGEEKRKDGRVSRTFTIIYKDSETTLRERLEDCEKAIKVHAAKLETLQVLRDLLAKALEQKKTPAEVHDALIKTIEAGEQTIEEIARQDKND